MIVVWNCERGRTYGFATLDDYKKFAAHRDDAKNMCWFDEVHDVGADGECTEDNKIDLFDFNIAIADGDFVVYGDNRSS